MYYDNQIVYGRTNSYNESFHLNGFNYYTTKTGITKKKKGNEKAVKVTSDEYNAAWNKYNYLFN